MAISQTGRTLPPHIAKRIRLSWLILLLETGVRAFWPAWSAAFVAFAAWRFTSGFAWMQSWPFVPHTLIFLCVAIAIICGARVRIPPMSAAEARLDRALPHRPLTAIRDRQRLGRSDSASVAVWREHQVTMARLAGALPIDRPDLSLAREDQFAVRYVCATMLILALLFAPAPAVTVDPRSATPGASPTSVKYEAWLVPPPYTARPTLYLDEAAASAPSIIAPVGSIVALRFYGDHSAHVITEDFSDGGANMDGERLDYSVARSGPLRIRDPDGNAMQWQFNAIADLPPGMPRIGDILQRASGGTSIPVGLSDDYGVQQAEVSVSLALEQMTRNGGLAVDPEPRPDPIYAMRLPFARSRTNFDLVHFEDFSDHRWSGLPVRMSVSATDAIGQSTRAEQPVMNMPGRQFDNPLAGVLAEQRRDLLWNRENLGRIVKLLEAVAAMPERQFENVRDFMIFRMATRTLQRMAANRLSDDDVANAEQMLWRAALRIEEGNLGAARDAVRAAAEALSDALRRGASQEEIERLAAAYREAMQEFLREMASRPGDADRQPGDGESVDEARLREFLDELERLMREGRQGDAAQALRQLQEMLASLIGGGGGSGGGGSGEMEELRDALRQQQGLSDRAFQLLQQQRQDAVGGGQGNDGQGMGDASGMGNGSGMGDNAGNGAGSFTGMVPGGGGNPGDGPNGTQGSPGGAMRDRPEALSRAQEALSRKLRDEMARQGAMEGGSGLPSSVDEAADAMMRASESLLDRQLEAALDEQGEAMRNLGAAIRELWQEMAANGQGGGPPGTMPGVDPLGRSGNNGFQSLSRDWMLRERDANDRVMELRREIGRRAGDLSLPQAERDYLRRLLRRY